MTTAVPWIGEHGVQDRPRRNDDDNNDNDDDNDNDNDNDNDDNSMMKDEKKKVASNIPKSDHTWIYIDKVVGCWSLMTSGSEKHPQYLGKS